MKHILPARVRETGYETLFLLGGFLNLSLQPTARNFDRFLQSLDEPSFRRGHLRRLQERGLLELDQHQGNWVARLTESGRTAFAGGRHPELAWNRPWDGQWRLLSFDLPSRQKVPRMKLWRWLCANHFGHLQGSVWITPDPVPSLEDVLAIDDIDPTNVMVFEGTVAGKNQPPRTVAAHAWDFPSIDSNYRRYTDFTERVARKLSRAGSPSHTSLQNILREDRKEWWNAIRKDPLLPKAFHPKGYEGPRAWRARCKLLKKLATTRNDPPPS